MDSRGGERPLRTGRVSFGYLDSYAWPRVTQWLLKRHKHLNWAELYRRFLTGRSGHRPAFDGLVMFDTTTMPVTPVAGEQHPHTLDQQRRNPGSCLTVASGERRMR